MAPNGSLVSKTSQKRKRSSMVFTVHVIIEGMFGRHVDQTLRSSEERKPPIHMKQRSAGDFHMPESM